MNELAVRIVERHLDALSKSRYGLIARELKASPEEVRAACDVIRSLNPRPGTGFAARENLTYINPDIIVVSFPDHFELLTNDYYFPTLNISGYYTRLMKESDDSQVKDYLTGKVRQAKWMVKAIEQRRSTLMACAECILEFQESFSQGARPPGSPVPGRRGRAHRRPRVHSEPGGKGEVYPVLHGCLSPELLFLPQPGPRRRRRGRLPRRGQGAAEEAYRRGGQEKAPVRPKAL